MPCAGCQKARAQFGHAVRTGNLRQAAQAVSTAVAINTDKLRGMSREEIDRKYGGGGQPYVRTVR